MVKRTTLERLSTADLEKFISPDSRKVADAVEMAIAILKERGRIFSEEEDQELKAMVERKRAEEFVEPFPAQGTLLDTPYEDPITTDESAISLYSQRTILLFLCFVGMPFAIALQAYNFLKLHKTKAFFTVLLFGIILCILQYFLWVYYPLFDEWSGSDYIKRKSNILFIIPGIGAVGLVALWKKNLDPNVSYRSKNYLFPLLLSLAVLIVLYLTVGFIPGFSILNYLLHLIMQ